MVSYKLCLLFPTSKTYVYPLTKPPVSTPILTSVSPAANQPVAPPPAFDDLIVPTAVAESSAPEASDPTVPSDLLTSAKLFIPKLFHYHQYKPDRLDALIQGGGGGGDLIRTVRGKGDMPPDIANIPHPVAQLLHCFLKVDTPAIMSELVSLGLVVKSKPH